MLWWEQIKAKYLKTYRSRVVLRRLHWGMIRLSGDERYLSNLACDTKKTTRLIKRKREHLLLEQTVKGTLIIQNGDAEGKPKWLILQASLFQALDCYLLLFQHTQELSLYSRTSSKRTPCDASPVSSLRNGVRSWLVQKVVFVNGCMVAPWRASVSSHSGEGVFVCFSNFQLNCNLVQQCSFGSLSETFSSVQNKCPFRKILVSFPKNFQFPLWS